VGIQHPARLGNELQARDADNGYLPEALPSRRTRAWSHFNVSTRAKNDAAWHCLVFFNSRSGSSTRTPFRSVLFVSSAHWPFSVHRCCVRFRMGCSPEPATISGANGDRCDVRGSALGVQGEYPRRYTRSSVAWWISECRSQFSKRSQTPAPESPTRNNAIFR